jgi:hypothetical protein
MHSLLLAFKNGPRDAEWNDLHANSNLRHNIIDNPCRMKYSTVNGTKVNPSQKFVWPEMKIMKHHCVKGSWVVVLCAGSGTSVISALAEGFNVIAFELDGAQVNAMDARIHTYLTSPGVEATHVFNQCAPLWEEDDIDFLPEHQRSKSRVHSHKKEEDVMVVEEAEEMSEIPVIVRKCMWCQDDLGSDYRQCAECAKYVHMDDTGFKNKGEVDSDQSHEWKCKVCSDFAVSMEKG